MYMKYQPFLIQKFLGILIQEGNRFKALNFFFDLLSFLKQDVQQKPIDQLSQIINKLKPVVSYKKLRRGSKVIYLPKLLSYENQLKQAINWVVLFARERKKNLFQVNLFEEVVLSAKGEGKASKEKQKIYNLLIDSRPYLYLIKYY